jgi:hypothetical protein
MIWSELWIVGALGITVDGLASEAARLGGLSVFIPWLGTAIGGGCMFIVAIARAYQIPLIPEDLGAPDELLTRRSRILGERMGALPVRVFVTNLPTLRGKLDTFLDGSDLFVSERLAGLPEAERDFLMARALWPRSPAGIYKGRTDRLTGLRCALVLGTSWIIWPYLDRWETYGMMLTFLPQILFPVIDHFREGALTKRFGPASDRTSNALALRATGDLPAAVAALSAFAFNSDQRKAASQEAEVLEAWWNKSGQKAVEASEWYQGELSWASKEVPLTP